MEGCGLQWCDFFGKTRKGADRLIHDRRISNVANQQTNGRGDDGPVQGSGRESRGRGVGGKNRCV